MITCTLLTCFAAHTQYWLTLPIFFFPFFLSIFFLFTHACLQKSSHAHKQCSHASALSGTLAIPTLIMRWINWFFPQIVSTVEANQVTIIQGPTGSGKTTQVPQFILDQYAEESRYCNIVVTQPRKIAATSIANRVCEERGWGLGQICGYQVCYI